MNDIYKDRQIERYKSKEVEQKTSPERRPDRAVYRSLTKYWYLIIRYLEVKLYTVNPRVRYPRDLKKDLEKKIKIKQKKLHWYRWTHTGGKHWRFPTYLWVKREIGLRSLVKLIILIFPVFLCYIYNFLFFRAKVDLCSLYAVNSLFWMLMKTVGENPQVSIL